MPLSDHEQRILAELEESLNREDPEFADKVRNETAVPPLGPPGTVGRVRLPARPRSLTVCSSRPRSWLALVGVAIMFASAVVIQRNVRRMGRASWHDLTRGFQGRQPSGAGGHRAQRPRGPRLVQEPVPPRRRLTPRRQPTGTVPRHRRRRHEARRGRSSTTAVRCRGRAVGARRPRAATPTACFGVAASTLACVRSVDATPGASPVAAASGAGVRWTATRCRRSTSPRGAGSPCATPLAEALGLPVVVDNDAKALALAEGWLGAARGVANFLAMVVSTGVGGGIVLDGRLLDGRLGQRGTRRPRDRRAATVACARAARGAASRRRRPGPRSRRSTGAPAGDASRRRSKRVPARSSVARSRRSRACSTSTSRSSVARSRSASARRSSTPHSASCPRAPASRSPASAASSRSASASSRRSSARRALAMRALVRRRTGRAMNVRHLADDGPARARDEPRSSTSPRASRADPALWWPTLAARSSRFAPRGWWRRPPFLPVPDERYWRFRMETAYGDEPARHRAPTTSSTRCAGRGARAHADGRVAAHGARAPPERDVRAAAARLGSPSGRAPPRRSGRGRRDPRRAAHHPLAARDRHACRRSFG